MGEQTGGPAVVHAEEADPVFEAKCKEINAIEAQSEVTSTALQTLVEDNGTCAKEAQAPSAMRWKRTRSKRVGKTSSFTKYRLVPVAP
ncbi:hypothetical protein LPJ57_003442 [Coemansia sp. RSA 486]|nr:hypothetical protein LPJ57_003442 [Coemansia sp. RSA 486]KAJ2229669.1 hypothetical protein IWW45_006106 [Coemansia sp. RSA 485]